ncbi:hypothetical protein BO71DRAFT_485123 [Aspergillus ellipticus CBS 707.79]|uniref:Zn(II)2Cys6 transcription factor n=1 Tax=Aspergillus ellipticus CBS 707.79 TaxID=1448320 RepID=A0A319D5Y4_9EURO|nr:hypothetical protein BO71DRAFT_485123 [Aspergillus ellipticus CBS 707.79]
MDSSRLRKQHCPTPSRYKCLGPKRTSEDRQLANLYTLCSFTTQLNMDRDQVTFNKVNTQAAISLPVSLLSSSPVPEPFTINSVPASPPESDHSCHTLTTSTSLESETHTLNQDELKFLANWCSTTYQSFSQAWKNDEMWKVAIIRKALHQPALLKGIFALSALQLAHSSRHSTIQQETLRSAAHAYRDQACSRLSDEIHYFLEVADYDVLFALCSILVVFEFASTQIVQPSTVPSALESLCEIFRQLRISTKILVDLVDEKRDGQMELLVMPREAAPRMPSTFALAISALRRLNERHDDPEMKCIYEDAIDKLASCLRYMAWGSHPSIVELLWFLRVQNAMIDLIADHQSIALIIVAHYCVVLYHLREQWWMVDLGIGVLREITSLLDRDKLSTITWAMDVTGISPQIQSQ